MLGGRVCASRVSRGEARHPLVRVGDCERRCGAELILSGKVRVPSAVFPKHPREPSSPALPRRARRVPRARGGADLVITTRASRSARVSREHAFERAARPRSNARPGRVFFVSTAFGSNGIDGNARKKREVRGPGVGPRDARDDPHRLTPGSSTPSRSATTGSPSDRRAREGRARR